VFVRPLEISNGATGIEMRFDAFNEGGNAIGKDGSMVLLKNSNILLPTSFMFKQEVRPAKMQG
jgi:hypothetical protein